MAPLDNAVVLIASLLVGGVGIYLGARLLVSARNYTHALLTAGVGAVVWTVVGGLVGGIPLLGPALTLLAYLLVIRWRYGVGWPRAGGIALVAWVAALVVLGVLSALGLTSLSAVGIPNV